MSMKRRPLALSLVAGLAILLAALLVVQSPARAQQGGCQTFPQTGKKVCGRFLDYWNTHGGVMQQGYPISDEFREVSDLDGKEYTVQYFERAVFEYHPENKPPYDVLLSQLGTYQFKRKYPNGVPTTPGPQVSPTAGSDKWAALRQRPLRLPSLAPGSSCPTTPGRSVSPDFGLLLGDSPVYTAGFGQDAFVSVAGLQQENGWYYVKVLWVADTTYKGTVLVRGHQLDGTNEVRFQNGSNPAPELDLDTAQGGSTSSGWSNWPTYARVRGAGCYAFQVDGNGFTEIIPFRVEAAR